MILKFKTGHSQNQTSCPPIFRSSVISEPRLEHFGNQKVHVACPNVLPLYAALTLGSFVDALMVNGSRHIATSLL
jgi:hypothetical protein